MSQAIIRLDSANEDAELVVQTSGKVLFKKLSFETLRRIVDHYCPKNHTKKQKNIFIFDETYIGCGDDYVVINQPGCKKYVTLLGKSYKISFPNSIYIVKTNDEKNTIIEIVAFSYVEFKGKDTELYEYPMPNELGGNRICMGTADKKIVDGDYVGALERIIATEYTHDTFTGIKGFSVSGNWFDYLSSNEFPYKLMRKLNRKLKDVKV